MNYLKIETCQLLYEKDCMCESGKCYVKTGGTWDLWQAGRLTTYGKTIFPAFTWDDICTKENAIKIWGEDREVIIRFEGYCKDSEGNTDDSIDDAGRMKEWEYRLHILLFKKLNGEDWEAELLKQLEGK